ncbi:MULTISPECIES: hypothetical protein [Sphingobacterium]|uniref:hypothetical protein n=1 Tax=Sphingobacterium TaxID=28453 RepID=UPI0013DCB9E0|nr:MULTISPECIES: hypothetical protein [unclassified Sphingobacterium]
MKNALNQWLFVPLGILSLSLYTGCNSTQPQESKSTQGQDSVAQPTIESTMEDTLSYRDVGFGLFNNLRNQIILIDDEERPADKKKLKHAWVNAQSYKLEFTKTQKEGNTYNGRQTPDNFDNIPGAVFTLTEQAKPDEAYVLLCSDVFLKNRKPLTIKNNFADASSSSVTSELKKTYNRSITNAKLIATTSQKDSVFLMQLAPVADSLTVVLVAKTNATSTLFIQEFNAEYNEMSTWRVDDGGEFPMEDFTILNAFEHYGKIELATSFPGAEGGNLSFIAPDAQNRYQYIKEAYVYWSPL